MTEEKQIEEMAEMLEIIEKARDEYTNDITDHSENEYIREGLLNAGYHKQIEGEWIDSLKGYCQCSNCRTSFETLPTAFLFKLNNGFCRHCGAKMKGGE